MPVIVGPRRPGLLPHPGSFEGMRRVEVGLDVVDLPILDAAEESPAVRIWDLTGAAFAGQPKHDNDMSAVSDGLLDGGVTVLPNRFEDLIEAPHQSLRPVCRSRLRPIGVVVVLDVRVEEACIDNALPTSLVPDLRHSAHDLHVLLRHRQPSISAWLPPVKGG